MTVRARARRCVFHTSGDTVWPSPCYPLHAPPPLERAPVTVSAAQGAERGEAAAALTLTGEQAPAGAAPGGGLLGPRRPRRAGRLNAAPLAGGICGHRCWAALPAATRWRRSRCPSRSNTSDGRRLLLPSRGPAAPGRRRSAASTLSSALKRRELPGGAGWGEGQKCGGLFYF